MYCAIAYARAVDLVMENVSFSPKDSVSLCIINGPEKLFIAKSPIFSQVILRVLGPRSPLVVLPFSGADVVIKY